MADFQVVAKLMADASAFSSGVADAQNSLDGLISSSKKAMADVGGAMVDVGKGMTKAITAPVVAGVTAAIASYADLEQAIGGIETLFGDSANMGIANAQKAYKTAGVSATEYMEQVTSFSATLLQGLDGDTRQAAQYGDKAIVQMADNANKMGTGIKDIQNAYQGFAKDNYTMNKNVRYISDYIVNSGEPYKGCVA